MNKKALNDILKIVFSALKNILIPIAFIMYGWDIYSRTKNSLLVLNIALILIVYLLFILLFALRKNLNLQKREIKELWDVQDEIFKAVSLVLKSDQFFEDNEHRYSLIEINYRIKNTDGYATMHLVGKNVSGDASDHLRIRIAGDSPIDNVKDLDLHVNDKLIDEEIPAEVIKELETMHFKPHRIYFKDPILHGREFDIEITYRWPGAFTRQSDYVFYILHSYKKGVDHFKTNIGFSFKPGLVRLYEIQKGKESLISSPLAIPINRNKNSIGFEVLAPTKSLLLQWTPFFTK